MRNVCHLFLLPALCLLPARADLPMQLPSSPAVGGASMTDPQRPVSDAAPPTPGRQAQPLSEAELRIRIGIIMLGRLHDTLAGIKDEASAEAAVAPIMRASAEFMAWAQGFSSLPPLDADTQNKYESRYLPIIDELNTRIRIQGERLASAEFYGSQNLPAALVRLVNTLQQ